MPGAWELPRREVLVAVLTRETTTTAWAASHRNMAIPLGSEVRYYPGMPFDHARNVACHSALNDGFEYLFFVDDDVQVPPNAYEILKSDNLDIVSGLYYRRNEPIAPVAMVDVPGGQTWLQQWKYGQLLDVKYVGAGCLLIRRSVLETMSYPWFEWMCDRIDLPNDRRISEDFEFCRKAKKIHGYSIKLDTRVQCVHCGLSKSSVEGKMEPLTV